MKLVRTLSGSLAAAVLFSGCLYTNVRYPMDQNLDKTELGTKVGRAHMQSAAFLFAWGDASTRAAAENGQIKVINHLDVEQLIVVFGLYSKTTTIAYGD